MEVVIVIGLIVVIFLFAWLQSLGPFWIIVSTGVLLNLVNLAMTLINAAQARKRDPRFLPGWQLALIQILVGVALSAWIGSFAGLFAPLTLLVAAPFLAGGVLVLAIAMVGMFRKDPPRKGRNRDTARPIRSPKLNP